MSFAPLLLLPAFPTPAKLTPLRSSLCILACFLRLLIASLYLIVSLYSLISFFSKLLTYLFRSCIFCKSDCIIFCSSAFSSRCYRSFSCWRNRCGSSRCFDGCFRRLICCLLWLICCFRRFIGSESGPIIRSSFRLRPSDVKPRLWWTISGLRGYRDDLRHGQR